MVVNETFDTLVFPIDTVTMAGESNTSVRRPKKRSLNSNFESVSEFLFLLFSPGQEINSSEKCLDMTGHIENCCINLSLSTLLEILSVAFLLER